MSDADNTDTDSIEQEPTGETAVTDSEAYERAPADFESEIDTSDSTVPDHPVVVDVPGRGEASAMLLTEEEFERYQDVYGKGQDTDVEDIANDVVAAVLREHYESPDFSGLTGEDIDTSPINYYTPFLRAIAPHLIGAEGN